MSSKTQICNLALSNVGIGNEISNLETDKSAEAFACRRYFDIALEKMLGDFPWPFATKFLALGLIEEDPNEEWAFSYRYPSDCLKIRRLLSGSRNDSRQSRIPYKIGQDTTGSLIYTDLPNAELEYTVKISDVERLPPDFTIAFSFLLSSYIIPRLLGSDRFNMVQRALQLYQMEVTSAQASAANEEQADQEVESQLIRIRESGIDPTFDTTSFRPF